MTVTEAPLRWDAGVVPRTPRVTVQLFVVPPLAIHIYSLSILTVHPLIYAVPLATGIVVVTLSIPEDSVVGTPECVKFATGMFGGCSRVQLVLFTVPVLIGAFFW